MCVNSAGIVGLMSPLITKSTVFNFEDFKNMMEINLFGTVYCAAFCAFYMSKNTEEEKGVIINLASVAAYEAAGGMVPYGASKGGVAGLTLPMARDLGKFGIWVVSIAPAITKTPMAAALENEDLAKKILKDYPLGRFGEP